MTLNAVIRCSSCNRVSPKFGSSDGKCKQCTIIERALEYIDKQSIPMYIEEEESDEEEPIDCVLSSKMKEILEGKS